jgi:serine/threonine protein kinase
LFKLISLKGVSETDTALGQGFKDYLNRIVTLEHMHLQPIYGAGVLDDDHFYIVSRMIVGTLAELLQTGALSLERIFELGLQLTSALKYVHSNGFIHSSLSPQNIYLAADQSCYINDLEFAPILRTAHSLEQLQGVLDEPFYMSVEQLHFRPAEPRSDIYAVGAILYHMATGKPPFSEEINSFEKVLERKLQNQLIAVRHLNPLIPPRLEQIILQALRANPEERFATMETMDDVLKEQASPGKPQHSSVLTRTRISIRRLLPGH